MAQPVATAERLLFTRLLRPPTFTLGGTEYRCLWSPVTSTWRAERAVEIPVALGALNGEVLEVGNVLRQYAALEHPVVDKYEVAPGVINEDALTFEGGPFDTIVSVSTLEHVGYDETPRDPDKAARAIGHLLTLLKSGGELFVSFPFNYNRDFDDYVLNADVELACLRRLTMTRWEQASPDEAKQAIYGSHHAGAMSVGFARWRG